MGRWRGRRLTGWPGRVVAAVPASAAGLAMLLFVLAPPASAASLTSPTWTVSDTAPGATDVGYTYTFTTATTSTLDSVTMTVPDGTGGTPAAGTVSPSSVAAGGGVSLAGTTLTYTFTPAEISSGTAVSIVITGLTNTTAAGSYTSAITTNDAGRPVDSGAAPAVAFASRLTLTIPDTLSWSAGDTGFEQDAVDRVAADQQLTVDDETATGAGWHITVTATTFSSGTHDLPDTGVFSVTGSVTSLTSATPSAACSGPCVLPTDTVTYPVAVTTAAASPPASTLYSASAGTGSGDVTLGGSSAEHPLGWWISVPATAHTGSYSSALTITVASGP
jgi:WxL domain surface cell wall-binding